MQKTGMILVSNLHYKCAVGVWRFKTRMIIPMGGLWVDNWPIVILVVKLVIK